MARYDVYAVEGEEHLFLDVQADELDEISTRAIIPLIKAVNAPKRIRRLNPAVVIDGEPYILATQLVTAVPAALLRRPVAKLDQEHDRIIAALDMLFSGI